MSLLSKKSWNPTNSKNRERVKRDKERLAQDEEKKKADIGKRESEIRYRGLKRKKAQGSTADTESLITMMKPLPAGVKDRREDAREGHGELHVTTFGDSVREPWYVRDRSKQSVGLVSAISEKKKMRDDPQKIFEELDLPAAYRMDANARKGADDDTMRELSTIEKLRLERHQREKIEREKTENLLMKNGLLPNPKANERYTNRFKRD